MFKFLYYLLSKMTELKISLLISAICYYNSIDSNINSKDVPKDKLRIAINKMNQTFSQSLKTLNVDTKINLEELDDDFVINLYLNICNNESIRSMAQTFLNTLTGFKKNLNENITELIFQPNIEYCTHCNMKLRISYRNMNSTNKGKKILCWSYNIGVQTGLSYTYFCNGCDSSYIYGIHNVLKSKEYVNTTNYQQATELTFFDISMFKAYHQYSIHTGMSMEDFVFAFNDRNQTQYASISKQLQSQNIQKWAKRDVNNLCVEEDRFSDGYYLWILKTLLNDINIKCIIYEHELQQKKINKKNASAITNKKNPKGTVDVTVNDQIEILYYKHQSISMNHSQEWIKYVPVKNGEPMKDHFVVIGDGNNKVKRIHCQFSKEFECVMKENELNKFNLKRTNLFACSETIIRGNQHRNHQSICFKHLHYVVDVIGVNKEDTDRFIKYSNLKFKLKQRLNNKKQSEMTNKNKEYTKKINELISKKKQQEFDKKIDDFFEKHPQKITEYMKNKNDSIEKTIQYVINKEREDNEHIDRLAGCRKGGNIPIPWAIYTGGITNIMTCSGFILSMYENIDRETPTEICQQLYDCMTSSDDRIKYYCHMEGFGYDMVCNIYQTTNKLKKEQILDCNMTKFYSDEFMEIWFVDRLHVIKHTCNLCLTLFNCDKNEILKKLMKGVNTQIVEQGWVKINRLHFAKSLGKVKFNILLLDYRRSHNIRNMNQLKKKGYDFLTYEQLKISPKRTFSLSSTNDVINNSQTLKNNKKRKIALSGTPINKKQRT